MFSYTRLDRRSPISRSQRPSGTPSRAAPSLSIFASSGVARMEQNGARFSPAGFLGLPILFSPRRDSLAARTLVFLKPRRPPLVPEADRLVGNIQEVSDFAGVESSSVSDLRCDLESAVLHGVKVIPEHRPRQGYSYNFLKGARCG